MSIFRARTGLETDGDRFVFSTVKAPPAGALPDKGAALAGELAQHYEHWRASRDRHMELSTDKVRREARRKDADALGQAVRAGKPPGEPVHEQQLDAAREAAEQEMARAEAAGRVIAQELDALIQTSADTQVDQCRTNIETAREAHAAALADLEDARQQLVANSAYVIYWKQVAAGGSAAWGGRPAGKGASIRGTDGSIPLEPFAQMTASLRQEVARLARATSLGDTPAEGAA